MRSGGKIVLAAIVLCWGCSSTGDDGDQASGSQTEQPAEDAAVYPGAEWDHADPAELGFDAAVLESLAAEAEAAGSNCLLVSRGGQIVGEWYWSETTETTTQEVYSVTKSYSSTLVGIAQEQGLLDIDDNASEYIPEWEGTPAEAVTIRNLISNDSGRHWDISGDYVGLTTAADRDSYAIGLAQDAPPGTVWVYNNAAIQTLDAVLQAATGQDTATYADENLFAPIGMADSRMTTDSAGNAATYFGIQSTCQDLARFGYLFLREGDWEGTQVVPAAWVDEATQPSQDINPGYGYLWWLNSPSRQIGPLQPVTAEEAAGLPERPTLPGTDEDMYWAIGLGSQIIQVDPASDTVVVRLGPGDTSTTYGVLDTARFVTEALTSP